MASPCSRKHFFKEALSKGVQALAKWIDNYKSSRREPYIRRAQNVQAIASDFNATQLRQEAERLEIDPDSIENENLLKAVYDAMEKKYQSVRNDGGRLL